MKSKRAEFFDDAVVSGPDQKAFEEKIYAEAQAKRWPRVAEGTGKFEGQVVIVTGAAGGQGEMEAKMIAQQGAKVYMADIEEEGLKRVEAAIIADGGEAVAFPMDVADEGSWQELVKKVVDESGRLDVLVNNAGMCQNGTVLTETRESLNRIMDVDCWGVYNGMHYCAPAIIEAGGGTIVNTCSYQGTHFGPGSFIGYAMAKAAVMGMTRAAATDLGTYGIRVNAVNPGLVLSGMTLPRGQNRKGLVDASSMKRYALPEEIASVVMFLASDDSSFINGEFIAADGGATRASCHDVSSSGDGRRKVTARSASMKACAKGGGLAHADRRARGNSLRRRGVSWLGSITRSCWSRVRRTVSGVAWSSVSLRKAPRSWLPSTSSTIR